MMLGGSSVTAFMCDLHMRCPGGYKTSRPCPRAVLSVVGSPRTEDRLTSRTLKKNGSTKQPSCREGLQMRVLLVEDTEDVADANAASFIRRGDAIDCVDTVQAAEDTLAVNDYEVIILDINLPDGQGTDILRTLRRQRKPTPVLMLTARMAVEDRVAALDIGADDYLVKPFDLRELQARVRALGRRTGPDRSGIIEFGPLALDPAGRVATRGGEPLSLTRRELAYLRR